MSDGLRKRFRPRVWATIGLLVAGLVVAVWWTLHVPYDAQAIYRPVPASATIVGRHMRLPERWTDALENPLVRALLRTAEVEPEEALALAEDEESRKWFDLLAGREATLAWVPGSHGGPPALMAVSWLGGDSQKLRLQLDLFRLRDFERLSSRFPNRNVWRVRTRDLPPRQQLVIAFGEGILMACISENPLAIATMLAAADGNSTRLLDAKPSFARFAEADDRTVPDRIWLESSPVTAVEDGGITVDLPRLDGQAMEMMARTEALGMFPERAPEDSSLAEDPSAAALDRLLAGAPCAAVEIRREGLLMLQTQLNLSGSWSHAWRMMNMLSGDRMTVVLMDGEFGGRLTWGVMRAIGLAGLRVPTLLLATPAPDPDATRAAIGRVMDSCNSRYKGAFVFRPLRLSTGDSLFSLESAAGDEWVDQLAGEDRPAYALVDGWLLAASNVQALRHLLERRAAPADAASAAPPPPALWTETDNAFSITRLWLDLARGGRVAKDIIATWSMVQTFFDSGDSKEMRERLNEIKTWIDALAPFGSVRFSLGSMDGENVAHLELGPQAVPAETAAEEAP